MKKPVRTGILLWISLFLVLAGCGKAPYETYLSAWEKTETIEKGKSRFVLDLDVELSKAAEEIFQPLIPERLEVEHRFDKTRMISESAFHAVIDDEGIDGKLYQKEGSLYVVTPLLPKILVIRGSGPAEWKNQGVTREGFGESAMITAESEKEIEEIWMNLLNKENVTRLGNIVLNTPDGDIKAKEYRVNLTADEIRQALMKTIGVLSVDPLLKAEISKNLAAIDPASNPKVPTDEEIWQHAMQWLENAEIGPVSYLAYIDRDGFIIEERAEVTVKTADAQKGKPSSLFERLSFSFQLQRWDIGREAEINLPEVNPDNSITLEELMKEHPFPLLNREEKKNEAERNR